MSESIVMVIDKLCEEFGIVIDWTSENIVPYIFDLMNRVVGYEIATSVAAIVFALAAMVVTGVLYVHYNKIYKTVGTHDGMSFVFGILFVVCTVVFIITLILQTDTIIRCVFIPEKVFVEMLNNYL